MLAIRGSQGLRIVLCCLLRAATFFADNVERGQPLPVVASQSSRTVKSPRLEHKVSGVCLTPNARCVGIFFQTDTLRKQSRSCRATWSLLGRNEVEVIPLARK